MMQPGKVAVFFFLLCSVVCVCYVNAEECTEEQKEAILSNCQDYIGHKPPHMFVPAFNGPCCSKVRDVPNTDMKCIVKLLTPIQRTEYVAVKIQNLRIYCAHFPPPRQASPRNAISNEELAVSRRLKEDISASSQ